MTNGSTESIESWIRRHAHNLSRPGQPPLDTEAIIQFGVRVAQHVLAAQHNAAREARWKRPRVKAFDDTEPA